MSTYESISVIIPVLNGEETILRALDSINMQTLKPKEVLVVDNGSTDQTVLLVEKYRSRCDFDLLIYHEPIKGVANARNLGIEQSSGEYIAFLDCDDVWMKKKLELQISALNEFQVSFSCTALLNRESLSVSSGLEIKSKRDLCKFNFVATSSVMVRRTVIQSSAFFSNQSQFGEDWGAWIKALTITDCVFIKEPLVSYDRPAADKYSFEKVEKGLQASFNDAISVVGDKVTKGLLLSHYLNAHLVAYQIRRWDFKRSYFKISLLCKSDYLIIIIKPIIRHVCSLVKFQ